MVWPCLGLYPEGGHAILGGQKSVNTLIALPQAGDGKVWKVYLSCCLEGSIYLGSRCPLLTNTNLGHCSQDENLNRFW